MSIHLEPIGFEETTLRGRDELLQAVLTARSTLEGAKIEFLDMQVVINPDRQSATAHLTAKGQLATQREFVAQEFKVTLRKIEKQWLITHVETFRSLASKAPRRDPIS